MELSSWLLSLYAPCVEVLVTVVVSVAVRLAAGRVVCVLIDAVVVDTLVAVEKTIRVSVTMLFTSPVILSVMRVQTKKGLLPFKPYNELLLDTPDGLMKSCRCLRIIRIHRGDPDRLSSPLQPGSH